MIVRWTANARQDRKSQFDWLAERNPAAAIKRDDAISSAMRLLGEFPERARRGIDDTRELSITGTPLLVIYRLTAQTVQILRLFHSSQDWPERSDRR